MRTSWRPTLGSQPSSTAKAHLRMIARKKIGIETPISETKRLAWSTELPWRFAATNPSGMPRKRREDHRAERQLDRRREPLPDLLGDRAAGRDARPEVAASRSSAGSASTARRSGRRARTGRGSGRPTRPSPARRAAPRPASRAAPGSRGRRAARARSGSGRAGGAGGRRSGALRPYLVVRRPTVIPSLLLPDEAHGRERLQRHGARLVADHVRLEPERGLRVRVRHAREEAS